MNSSGRIYADVDDYHIETNYTDRRVSCFVFRAHDPGTVLYSESESIAPDSNLAYKTAMRMHDRARGFVAVQQKVKWPHHLWALINLSGDLYFTTSKDEQEAWFRNGGIVYDVDYTPKGARVR